MRRNDGVQEYRHWQKQHLRFTDRQLFTGYDVTEFEGLFHEKPVEWIITGIDELMEPIVKRSSFPFYGFGRGIRGIYERISSRGYQVLLY